MEQGSVEVQLWRGDANVAALPVAGGGAAAPDRASVPVCVRRYRGAEAIQLARAEERAHRRVELRRAQAAFTSAYAPEGDPTTPPVADASTAALKARVRALRAQLIDLARASGTGGGEGASGEVAALVGAFDAGSDAAGAAASSERWVVLREDGCVCTASDYVRLAAEVGTRAPLGFDGGLLDKIDPRRALRRRAAYVREAMRLAADALCELHAAELAHGALGPTSVALGPAGATAPVDERAATPWGVPLRVRLRDLALSVDVSDAALLGGATLGEVQRGASGADLYRSEELASAGVAPAGDGPAGDAARDMWGRASAAGARSAAERRAFALSEDVAALGVTFMMLALGPLARPNEVDVPTLERTLRAVVGTGEGAAPSAADEALDEARGVEDVAQALRDYVLADPKVGAGARARAPCVRVTLLTRALPPPSPPP
eukprot:PRCOL_00004348-RA